MGIKSAPDKTKIDAPKKVARQAETSGASTKDALRQSVKTMSYADGSKALSPNGQVCVDPMAQAGSDSIAAAFATGAPAKGGDPVEAEFQKLKMAGHGEAYALLKTFWDQPGAVGRIFAEEFVKSDLEPMLKPFDVASTVIGLSPDPKAQAMATSLSVTADTMRTIVGLIKGDTTKVVNSAIAVGLDVAPDLLPGTDGRVAAFGLRADGSISRAALKKIAANVGNTLIKQKLDSWIDGFTDSILAPKAKSGGGGRSRGHGASGSW